MNLLENLNPEQLAAVRHKDGPLLIVAGAGTGKTTVIAQRIAYLIEQGLATSEEILGLTFTEKGAGEMADRVGSLLPYGYFDLWLSTFHSFSERILKEHGLSIGLSTDFKLLNEFEQWALIKKNLAKFDLDYYRPLGNPTKFIRALLKHFSRAKDEDISPAAYLAFAEGLKEDQDGMLGGSSELSLRGANEAKRNERRGNLGLNIANQRLLRPADAGLAMTEGEKPNKKMAAQEAARINEVANAYQVYEQLLLDNNALDFGDLINYCLKIFRERPAILETYRRQFKYVMLDEFQDTNWSQYELIKLLAQPKNNLTVVGDDDQSIFRFRGASMSNILQFAKDYPEAKKIILVKNYRSRQNILDLSYEFIKQNNPNRLECRLAESDKLNKKLTAENQGQGEIKVMAEADLAGEVEQVINKITELKKHDQAASWNDFAILIRANDSANVFMNELDRRGLSYIFGARRGLYAKPVIMDVIAYLKLLDNYHESVSLWRILNLPIYNFTDCELADFNQAARKKAWSLYEVISRAETLKFSPETIKKIQPLLILIARQTALAREKDVSEIFLAFMNESGYLKYLANPPVLPIGSQPGQAGKTERENLEVLSLLNQFLKRLRDFTASNDDKSVKAFLTELNLELEAGEAGELAADLEAGPEAIKILTVHGAKGLEFKYVFIVNLVDKRFPTIERTEQISLPDQLVKEILPVGDVHLEEERRLFYVAMTRAGSGLYFSWARDYGGLREKKPSRFLMELGLEKDERPKSFKKVVIAGQACPGLRSGDPQSRKLASASEPESRIKPGMTTQMPNHFSYSQLAAYQSCPYQYRFAHILKIPVMGKEQFSFGKTMHATLQKLFLLLNEKKGLAQADLFSGKAPLSSGKISADSITFEEILKLYEASWLDDWYESKETKQARKKQGREILKVFYEKHRGNWPEVLFLEKGFNLKIADPSAELPSSELPSSGLGTGGTGGTGGEKSYILRGVIDRIDAADDGLKLVDYKTGRAKEKLTFAEKEQLFIYQLAAQELFKQPVNGLTFYYLDNNSQVEFIGRPEDLEKVKSKIISTIREISRGEFPPRPSQLCAWCDYNSICEFKD